MSLESERGDSPSRLICTEANFEGLPLGRLNAGGGAARSISHIWVDEYETESGQLRRVERRWVVGGSERYGLPGEKEQDVYVAILELISRNGGVPEDGVLSFSLYELLRIMGDEDSGQLYINLKRALRTLSRTTVESHRAFFSARSKQYISDEFQLFTLSWAETEDLDGNRVKDRHELLLHPYFVESYNDDYAGKLDTELYWSLKRATSKRMFRLLDHYAAERREGGSRFWEVDLRDLQGLMPLQGSTPAKLKETLNKAHEELLECGYLAKVEYTERKLPSVGRGPKRKQVIVKYRLGKQYAKRTFSKKIDLTTEQAAAVEQMRYWGVSRVRAIEAVISNGPEHCVKWATLLHFQPNVKRAAAGGLLLLALEEEYEWWEENARKVLQQPGRGKSDSKVSKTVLEKARELQSEGQYSGANVQAQAEPDDPDTAPPAKPEPDPDAALVWDEMLEIASKQINTPSFRAWFEGTVPVSWDGFCMGISVPNAFAKDYIEERFSPMLVDGLRTMGIEDPALQVHSWK